MAKKKKPEDSSEFETFSFDEIMKEVNKSPLEAKNKDLNKNKSHALTKFLFDTDLENGNITKEFYIEKLTELGIPFDEAITNQIIVKSKIEPVEKKRTELPSQFITSKAKPKKAILSKASNSKSVDLKKILRTPTKKNVTSISEIEEYLLSNYDFRYNPVLDRTEFKIHKERRYTLLSERHINSLFRELNNNGHKCLMATLKSLLNSDFIESEDPFIEYFESLPKWRKGDKDYIGELMKTIGAENDDFFKWSFPKWLVATVVCSINPERVNQQVLVLVGKQGLGKSTWLNKLVPRALDGYLYTGIVNPSNKDTLVNLSENFLINLDELENLNKTELGSLKSLITQSAIRLRKAYGVFNDNFTRRASFVGSVNEVEFLTDQTGNRRYLVINCNQILYEDLENIDFDLVYSQAYSLYKNSKASSSFKYWFAGDDINVIDDNNHQFIRVSIEEELLLQFYRPAFSNDIEIEYLTPTEILSKLQQKTEARINDASSLRRIGNALQKHGFKKVSKGNSKPYEVCFTGASLENPRKLTP